MIEYRDECVGCPPEQGCLGKICPNKRVRHLYCDNCGDEADKLYKFYDDEEVCEDCLKERFEVIV